MTTNFNAQPYFDDWDEDKKFYKILFKPSLAVQARELTQLQTAIQKQVERFGSSIYKEGALILGANFGYTDELHAVKLVSTFNNTPVDDYIDQFKDVEIYGEISGVRARVVTFTQSNSTDEPTLFVNYISTGYDKVTTKFIDGENLIAQSEIVGGISAGIPSVITVSQNCTAVGSSANIERGVYYTLGHFVLVDAQRIVVSKYTNRPNVRIGLKIVESIITSNDDSSLLDNAQGTPNFAARGADRYSIDLQLTSIDINSKDDSEFIELARVVNGKLVGRNLTSELSKLEETLANRMYEVNGDYFVDPYQIRVRESLNDGLNLGVYNQGDITQDRLVNPTKDMVAIQISSGKAYVKGYEVITTGTVYLDADKTRTKQEIEEIRSRSTPLELGAYLRVTNCFNIPEMVSSPGNVDFDPFYYSGLYDAQTITRGVAAGNQIGVCRVRAFETEFGTGTNILDYSSIHKSYIFDVSMFTTLTTSTPHGLVAGDFITGVSSKATGYVHSSSSGSIINLTSVSGTFNIGESLISSNTGLTSTYSISSTKNNKLDKVKQIVTQYPTTNRNFTADLLLSSTFNLTGTITINGTSISGFGTTFNTQIEAGDIISIPSGPGGTQEQRIILSVTDNLNATLSAPVTNNVTSVGAVRLRSSIADQNKDILIRQLAKNYIKTLKTESNNLQPQTSVEIRREFIADTDSTSAFKLTAGPNESFNAKSNIDYQISVITPGTGGSAVAGELLNLDAMSFSLAGGTVTIGSPVLGVGAKVKVNATINRSNVQSKEKTPRLCQRLEVINKPNGVYGTSATHKEISLGTADVYRIRAIYSSNSPGVTPVTPTMSGTISGLFSVGETIRGSISGALGVVVSTSSPISYVSVSSSQFVVGDVVTGSISAASMTIASLTAGDSVITSRYLLDSGQRDNLYDISRLTLKPRMSSPTGNLLVIYDYFEHQDGDFFTVDSYSGISYEDIPYYSATKIDPDTEQSTGVFDLRSTVDFRPRVADIPSIIVGVNKVITGNSFDQESRKFSGFGSSITNIYKDNSNFEYDIEYYLSRIDSLFLTSKGEFKLITGVSAETPIIAGEISNAVRIADIYYDPYVLNTSKNITIVNHIAKRFTMNDISKLEKRISNVEYYTSLSLLEKSAETMQIKDNQGLDRFKSGFIVDNFSGHNVGDVLNRDYKCAMDMTNNILRPMFKMKNILLEESTTDDNVRKTKGYVVRDNYAMLPYTHEVSSTQPYATTIENLNPVLFFGWNGHLKLVPSADEWFDTEKLPVVTVNIDEYSTILAQNANSIGTIWDAPEVNWTGSTSTTRNITRAGEGGLEVLRVVNTTQTGTQTQRGIQTSLVERIDVVSSGDKTVSTSLVPFIRQKEIHFEAKGMKPHTVVYPTFDGVDVSRFCVPTTGSISSTTATTPTTTVTGQWNSLNAMKFDFTWGTLFNKVEVNAEIEASDLENGPFVKIGTVKLLPTQTTATVNFTSQQTANSLGEKFIRIKFLFKGTISAINLQEITILSNSAALNSSTLTSIISYRRIRSPRPQIWFDASLNAPSESNQILDGAELLFKVFGGPVPVSNRTVLTHKVEPSNVDTTKFVTDGTGSISGIFYLPDPKSIGAPKFETGIRQFKLESVPLSSNTLPETVAIANYTAQGILTKTQETVTRTRTGTLVSQNVTSTTNVSRTSTNTTVMWRATTEGDGGPSDPLAQTFFTVSRNGEFLTKIDVFFFAKDDTIPVRLQLVEVVNGTPTKNIVPGSVVILNPENVNTSPNASIATTFEFDAPVFVDGTKEYAFVLLTDSTKYLVWISRLGEKTVDGRFVSEQPTLGVLFKSQNNRTWTAYDQEDIKFTIYRAKFALTTGTVELQNESIKPVLLDANPFESFGTTTVKVYHPDHGMYGLNNRVIISGSNTTEVPNGEYTISNRHLDYYTIQVPVQTTTLGRIGGNNVTATHNAVADSYQVMIPSIVLPSTQIKCSLKLSTATSPSGNQVSFGNNYQGVIALTQKYDNISPLMIASEINEQRNRAGEKSAVLTLELSSSDERLTPIIDLERKSITTYSNRINNIVNENDVYPPETYVSKTSPDNDSGEAIYMTKRVQLSVPATSIDVYADIIRNNSANVTFMYKTLRSDDSMDFDDISWNEFTVNTHPNPVSDRTTYLEYKSSVEGLPEFIAFAIKIKMDGTNSCEVPLIKNLRAIALAL